MPLPELVDATLSVKERIALLTLQRDDVRNALTGSRLAEEIVATVDWANTDPDVSVLIITGAGGAFCAGGNVKEMRDHTGIFAGSALEVQDRYRRTIQQIPRALHRAEIPLIAAINGPAIGAGMDLACMCDLRLGTPSARLGMTFINLGIVPGTGGAWFLQRLVGYQRAAEITLTGRLLQPEEALDLGLLLEIVDGEDLIPRAMELAREIASKPPITVRMTKRLMKLAQRQELDDFLDVCAGFQGMAHHTEDHRTAVEAFLDKKAPSFKGK